MALTSDNGSCADENFDSLRILRSTYWDTFMIVDEMFPELIRHFNHQSMNKSFFVNGFSQYGFRQYQMAERYFIVILVDL